jgi:hypothetical protein
MKARRVWTALVGLNVLLVVALLVQSERAQAAKTTEALRVRVLELVDKDGRVRAQLKVEDDGEAVLRLRDAKGEVRVKLGAGSDGSGLLLLNDATEPAIQMLANRNGTTVTLRGKDGQARTITP